MAKSARKSVSQKRSAPKAKPAKSPQKPVKPAPRPAPRRKLDWEMNHRLITETFYELLRMRKRAPQISEISERTGLNYSTVQRHIRSLDLSSGIDEHTARLMANEVIVGLGKAGIGGHAKSAELFFEILFGFKKTSRAEVTGRDGGPVEMGVDFDKAVALIQQQLKPGGSDESGAD